MFDTLSGLVLQQDEVLLMSGTGLQDCFYQFAVSEQRVTRNHLACELSAADAAFVFERSPESLRNFGNPVLCGLSWATLQLASSLSAATWVLVQGRALFPGRAARAGLSASVRALVDRSCDRRRLD